MSNNLTTNEDEGSEAAKAAVFVKSEDIDNLGYKRIAGPVFGTSDSPMSIVDLMKSYETIGFQATGLTRAIDIIDKMRTWRANDEEEDEEEVEIPADAQDAFAEYLNAKKQNQKKCLIMLGYTSNLVSSGLREVIRYLVQHKHVSGLVTTAGGIEEDLIKCLGKTYLAPEGRFDAFAGADLRKRGINRIGNLLVPNDNYCLFEDWVIPILDKMVLEQVNDNVKWSPSSVIRRLGLEINHPDSILYWAAVNDIPVFCPALTDGSFGDMLYFHTYKADPEPLSIDIVSDIRRINDMSVRAKKAGMIILGGGVCKHQIANSMLFRNGADYAVYINTGQEFDGSDSGARPDEAVSWGKIKAGAEAVKIYADATIVFPLLVAATWAKDHSPSTTADEKTSTKQEQQDDSQQS